MALKRLAAVAAGLTAMASLAGCPDLVPSGAGGSISCGPGTTQIAVTPGFTSTAGTHTLSVSSPGTATGCDDRTGTGITDFRVTGLDIVFPSVSCLDGRPVTGTGTATLAWSDGTISTADLTGSLDGPVTGGLTMTVTSGHFTGFDGSARFLASPTAGDCTNGITSIAVTLDRITLRS